MKVELVKKNLKNITSRTVNWTKWIEIYLPQVRPQPGWAQYE